MDAFTASGIQPPAAGDVKTFICSVCGDAGATQLISRAVSQRYADAAIQMASDSGANAAAIGDGGPDVAAEVTTVCCHHFPAAFAELPPRTKQHAIAGIWARIDERAGRAPVSRRLAPIRTRLASSAIDFQAPFRWVFQWVKQLRAGRAGRKGSLPMG